LGSSLKACAGRIAVRDGRPAALHQGRSWPPYITLRLGNDRY
jgi:hypothetical protein